MFLFALAHLYHSFLPILHHSVTVDPLCPNHLQQALVQNREGLAELVTHTEIPNFYANDVILDPCVGNAHDCCMSTYGSGEYPTGSVSQTGYPEVKGECLSERSLSK